MSGLTEAAKQKIRDLLPRYPSKQAVTLPALHIAQEEARCVTREAVREIADILELSPAQIHDTLSFYGFFKDEKHPLGENRIWVCRSLACMLRGGDELLAEVCERLHVSPGQTTKDGKATIELAECLGACDGAPCILVNDKLQLRMTADAVVSLAEGRA
jgi:NADH-quinone oxidoreductase subunit E